MPSPREIQRRIERLEEVYRPPEALVILLVDFVSPQYAPVLRWKSHSHPGFCVERLPGESEEALAQRARADAQAWCRLHPSQSDCLTLFSERVANLLQAEGPDPEPKPQAQSGPIPTLPPARTAAPKPQAGRTTIEEVESLGPSRDWMA